jgi:hypothetical protein
MTLQQQKLKRFIKKNEHLFWYTPKKDKKNISDELLMEFVLNYTELPTIKEYFKIVGLKKAKAIFREFKGRKKGNLYPEIYNLFSKYFERFA